MKWKGERKNKETIAKRSSKMQNNPILEKEREKYSSREASKTVGTNQARTRCIVRAKANVVRNKTYKKISQSFRTQKNMTQDIRTTLQKHRISADV
jgi:hypothetical protein